MGTRFLFESLQRELGEHPISFFWIERDGFLLGHQALKPSYMKVFEQLKEAGERV